MNVSLVVTEINWIRLFMGNKDQRCQTDPWSPSEPARLEQQREKRKIVAQLLFNMRLFVSVHCWKRYLSLMLIIQRSHKCSLVHHDGGGSASVASFIFTHPGNKQKKHTRKRPKPRLRRMMWMCSFPSNLLTPANTRSCMSQPSLSPWGPTFLTPHWCQQQLSCPDGRKMWKFGCINVTRCCNVHGQF